MTTELIIIAVVAVVVVVLVWAPWNRQVERRTPREWLIRRLAGQSTVVLNADFAVEQTEPGRAISVLLNAHSGETLVEKTTGLGIRGIGRLADKSEASR